MLNVRRRVTNLERAMGVSDRTQPIVHRIHFIDPDGTVTETMVLVHSSCALRMRKYSEDRKAARWG